MNQRVIVLLSLSLLWSQHAAAGTSAELRVRGLIKPAACDLVFANGATIDVGSISKSLLNEYQRTLLHDEKINFSITCDAPVRVSLDLTDNRAGTAAANASLKPLPFLFGLGQVDAKNVGAYTLSFDEQAVADQKTVRMIAAQHNAHWERSHPFLMPNRRHSWTNIPGTSNTPTPFSTLTGVITLAPSVAPSRELPAEDEVALDGLASFELKYL